MKLNGGHEAFVAWPARHTVARRMIAPRGLAILSLLVLVAGLAVGCGGSSSSGGNGDSDSTVLRVGLASEPSSNPAKVGSKGGPASVFFSLAYAPLIHTTPKGEAEPALAESWRYVDSGGRKSQVFELTLRKGAKFSDGTPVDAEAVVRWFEYFTEASGPFAAVLGKDPKFTVRDSQTVRIKLSGPNPQLPRILSDSGPNIGFVMSPKAIENPKLLVKETAGAGPYMLDSSRSVPGDHYHYVPNRNYYGDDVERFKEVNVRVIGEAASRLQTQVSGQLDVAEGDSSTIASAESSGLEVASAPSEVAYLTMDLIHGVAPELKDPRVRQAINLAIDRESIVKALFKNTAIPTSSFIPVDVETGLEDYWSYDPDKARQLLKEAGYEDGLTLTAICAGAMAGVGGEPLVRAVAKNLEEVGVKLEITAYNNEAAFGEAIYAYESAMIRLAQGTGSLTTEIWGVFMAPGAVGNFSGTDPQMEKFYNAGLVAADPEESWRKMYERYTSKAYVVPVLAKAVSYFASESVGGVNFAKTRPIALASEWFPK